MSEFDILSAAAAGMDAQRAALDVAARNVAAAQVAGPHDRFSRLVPVYATSEAASEISAAATAEARVAELEAGLGGDRPGSLAPGGGEGFATDARAPIRFAGTRVERGRDVDVVTEMVGVLDAERAFEANASLFDAGKRLAEHTIDVGRL